MGERADRQKQELRMRKAAYDEEQRQQIIRQIEGIRRDQLPIDHDPNSLSDQIIDFQVKSGLRKPEDREGLSIGLKKTLFDAAMRAANPAKYSEQAWQDQNGNWVEEGLFGTVVPAKQLIPTLDDFEAEERQDRQFKREADAFWNRYRVMFPDDDPQAIAAAMRQSGLSKKELLDIASDENTRFIAAQQLHAAIEAMQAASGQDQQDNDPDDGRTDFGNTVSYSGTSHGQQTEERSANKYTPMQRDMIELQRKMGIRKW